MRELFAFVRRDALVAASYRTQMVFSAASLLTLVVPLFFITRAIQPIIGPSIASEGGEYFAFVIAGMATYQFVSVAVSAVPTALASALRTGTLEALLTTPVRLPVIVLGMMGYKLAWTAIRALILIAAAALLGAQFELVAVVPALLVWALLVLAYLPFGILAGALLIVSRTAGPLPNAVLTLSVFLGGVYYPTTVIPSWLGGVSDVIPLTYGLRAVRRLLAGDTPIGPIAADLGMLGLLAAALLIASAGTLSLALRHARRAGTLARY